MVARDKLGYSFMSDASYEQLPDDAFAEYAKGVEEKVIPELKKIQKQKEVDAAEAMSRVVD